MEKGRVSEVAGDRIGNYLSIARMLATGAWDDAILGPPGNWPNCLKSAVDIMLPSHAQIVMFWGEQHGPLQ